MSRLIRIVALMLACAGLLSACGSDDKDSKSTSTAATTPPTPTDTTSTGATGATGATGTSGATGKITKNPANAKVKLTVGSKNFTEQKVLGEIYAEALKDAGYTVKTALNLGDQDTALKAVTGGTVSMYPEYTGTALLSFFGVKSDAIPKDPNEAFNQAKDGFAKKKLVALPPTPFTSSNEVAVTKATAAKYNLTNISDLKAVAGKLKLYGSPECRQRLDCLLGLKQVYGLKFKSFTPVDVSLRHEVLVKKQADVSIVFTTDPQIKRDGFVLLKDDKGMFPPYNSTLVVRQKSFDAAGPDLLKTVLLVQQGLTADAMQELNARVDLDKKDPAEVAKEYLSESGYTG